jgi:hypothetical protein
MKITNKQLKKIIKEELQTVMNESEALLGLAALAAAKKRRAAAAKKKAAQKPLPRGGYKRGYGGPSSSSSSSHKRNAEIQNIIQQRADEEAAKEAERERYTRNTDPSLEALGQAKLKAILTLGRDEDGELPYMYAWAPGGGETWLGTYYDGPLDYYEAMDLAKRRGFISDSDIDDESGGFYIDNLFPGKFTPDQLPIFDIDNEEFYNDDNLGALAMGGYTEEGDRYTFSSKGEATRKLLGL